MTQGTIVEVNQAASAIEEKMTLGALQAMIDLWAKHHGERKMSIIMTDAECFFERLKQPRINKWKRRYENKNNQELFHAFLEQRQKQGFRGILRRRR